MANFINILPGWSGIISSGFGLRGPIAGAPNASTYHKGVDLPAAAGSAVLAPSGANIKSITVYKQFGLVTGGGYGVTLQTVMTDGTIVYTVYWDMSNTSSISGLVAGKTVTPGTPIGQVGAAIPGVSTNAHLHYQEMLSVNGSLIPVDPTLNWFGLTQGTSAIQNAGTGINIPGGMPNPAATYRQATDADGSIWLLYNNGVTFHYSNTFKTSQQWTIPNADGTFTTITSSIYNAYTPNASMGEWVTQHFDAKGVPDTAPIVGLVNQTQPVNHIAIAFASAVNPFLDPAMAQAFALAQATGSNYPSLTNQAIDVATGNTKAFTIYASGANAVDQIIQLTLKSGTCELCTGANIIAFDANGNATVTIPAGQDHVTITLVDTANTSE